MSKIKLILITEVLPLSTLSIKIMDMISMNFEKEAGIKVRALLFK
jgi:hypothetical protein